MPIKITEVAVEKHEGQRVEVRFLERDTDKVLFTTKKNLRDDVYVSIHGCEIENVDGKAKLTIQIAAVRKTK